MTDERPFEIIHLPLVQTHLRRRFSTLPEVGEGPPRGSQQVDPAIMKKQHAQEFEMQQLMYALGAAYHYLTQLATTQRQLIQQFVDANPGPNVVYLLGDEARPLAYAVDSYLDAARRAQNSVTVYISKALRQSIPSSLHDFAGKLEKHQIDVPKALREAIVEYWSTSGKRLKAYRDLAQHHAIVSSDTRMVMTSEAKPLIFLTLPNNPDAKQTASLQYREPVIHAFGYCSESFVELFRFLYEATYLLARILGPSKSLTMVIVPRDPLQAGEQPGHEAPSVSKLASCLWAERKRMKPLCESRYGGLSQNAAANPGVD